MSIFLFFQILLISLLMMLFCMYMYLLRKLARAERQSGIKISRIWQKIIIFNIAFILFSAIFILFIKV